MRLSTVLATLMLLAACVGQSAVETAACADPRPQVCTMEYDPVCAVLIKGGTKQYSSPCNACADDNVVSYSAGSCPK